MKGVPRGITLTLLCSALAASVSAEDALPTYAADETVVTATKQESLPEAVPQPVSVISAETLENRQIYNAGEALDFVPGVRIVRAGSVGASHGVSIRSLNGGPSSNKTLVLLDGRPVNDAWAGGVNWHAIPFEQIERIEVVRGPGSALYGSQATGGVVSVFTKRPEPGFHGWLSLGNESEMGEDITDKSSEGYGRPQVGANRVGLNASYGGERSRHFVSFGYRGARQEYVTPGRNDWGNQDAFYKGDYDLSESTTLGGSIGLHANTWENRATSNPADNETSTASADFRLRHQRGINLFTARAYLNAGDYETSVLSTNLSTGNTSRRTGLYADWTRPLGESALLVAGVDGFYDTADIEYSRTVMDMTYAGVDSVYYIQSGVRRGYRADTYTGAYGSRSQTCDEYTLAAFAQYSRFVGERASVVLGGRIDHHSEFGAVFNPKAGMTWKVFERNSWATTLKANFGTAFRSPPMVDLFSKDIGGYGDPDMKPEKTRNFDVGFFQRFGTLGSAELTWFVMRVEDLMVNDKQGSTGEGRFVFVPNTAGGMDTLAVQQRMNLGSYTPRGAELGITLHPHRMITLRGNYTYLDPRQFTFQTSRHRYNAAAEGRLPLGPGRLEGEVTYNHTGDGYFFDYEARPYDGFGLTDVRVSYALRDNYRVSVMVRNLMDTKYQLWHYAWEPGRSVSTALETRF